MKKNWSEFQEMVEYADPLPYHFAASYSFLSYQIVFIYNIFHPHIFSGNMISAEVPQKRKKKTAVHFGYADSSFGYES